MSTSAVVVTLAIVSAVGQHEHLQLLFSGYPSTGDLAGELGEPKWAGLLDSCEVSEIAEYQEDFESADGFISFECHDDADKFVGFITLDERQIVSLANVE